MSISRSARWASASLARSRAYSWLVADPFLITLRFSDHRSKDNCRSTCCVPRCLEKKQLATGSIRARLVDYHVIFSEYLGQEGGLVELLQRRRDNVVHPIGNERCEGVRRRRSKLVHHV